MGQYIFLEALFLIFDLTYNGQEFATVPEIHLEATCIIGYS
jgi:hypothetical protein